MVYIWCGYFPCYSQIFVKGDFVTGGVECIHVCMYVHTYIHIFMQFCLYPSIHTYIHIYMSTYIHPFTHICRFMYVCLHTCIYTCRHMNACLHIHAHTYTSQGGFEGHPTSYLFSTRLHWYQFYSESAS